MNDAASTDPLWAAALHREDAIGVYLAPGISAAGRSMISAGTERTGDADFAPDSFVPRGPWADGESVVHRILRPKQQPNGQVGVYTVDPDIVRQLQRSCEPNAGLELRRGTVERLLEHCDTQIARVGGNVHIIGLTESRAGGPTITRDNQQPGRPKVGLHVDSWDGPEIADRAQRSQRICINLGCSYRFLLFINRPVTELDGTFPADVNKTVRKFLREHRDYPVVAVRVNAGEAYIAPTEYLIHDGWNPSEGQPDRTFTVRAHFEALPIARTEP